MFNQYDVDLRIMIRLKEVSARINTLTIISNQFCVSNALNTTRVSFSFLKNNLNDVDKAFDRQLNPRSADICQSYR
jgi:hypothetical protein